MKKAIDELFEKEHRPVSLIWKEKKEFEFMCWHYIDFAEAMGFEAYNETPLFRKIREGYIKDEKELLKIKEKNFFDTSRFSKELRDMKNLKKNTTLPVGGGCFGPLTVASSILGAERTNKLSIKNPKFLEDTVEYVTKHMIKLAKEEAALGMDFFWIAEPLASLFSPNVFEKFCGKYLKAIFDSIEEPGYLHVCGKTIKHTNQMVDTGAQVLSIDYSTDIFDCIRMVPEDVVIMGNINPMLLKHGSKEEIKAETLRINDACKNYKNFIFSSGCSIPDGTPVENIYTATDITENYDIFSNEEYREIRGLIKLFLSDEEYEENKVKNSDRKFIEIAKEEAKLIKDIDTRYKNGRY